MNVLEHDVGSLQEESTLIRISGWVNKEELVSLEQGSASLEQIDLLSKIVKLTQTVITISAKTRIKF